MKLNKGDKVGIISASNVVEEKDIEAGLKYLTSLGFECILSRNVFNKYRWMAGSERERADDINTFYRDKNIKAIFTTSGGAGSQKILDFIDYEAIKNNPKPLFGFSDTTALQLALYTKANITSYSGFLLKYDFKTGQISKTVEESLQNTINGKPTYIQGGKTVKFGKAEGVLVGGCLSLIRNLAGTEYYPDLENVILLIEDVSEKTYKLDLMLDQIKKSKNFSKIKGVVFGEFTDCEISETEPTTLDEVINNFSKTLNVPIIKNFPYGHIPDRHILPIGGKVTLDADRCELSFS